MIYQTYLWVHSTLDINFYWYTYDFISYLYNQMVKKENTENCSCKDCKCWSWCRSKILLMLFAAVGCVAAIIACVYSCKNYKLNYDLNILPQWGKENVEKMNELYKTQSFIDYVTERTDASIESFNAQFGSSEESENTQTNSAEDVKVAVEEMIANSPVRGNKDARFTIIEYTELLCPYCQMHSQQKTIDSVIEQFPDEVNSVSRHFIIHGQPAVELAAAMECVAELNPEAYHNVFEKAFDAYPVELTWLVSIAIEAGTDATALQACIDEGRYTQAVNDMMTLWSQLFGVSWTPGNIIVDRETGAYKAVSWAQPVDAFVSAINSMKNA